MEVRRKETRNVAGDVLAIEYKEEKTQDKFTSEDEEVIRNEIINVLAKHSLCYWKAKIVLERTTAFLDKEAVVQEIIY